MTEEKAWIIDLIYPEAVDKVMQLNIEKAFKDKSFIDYFEIGTAKRLKTEWVGIYAVKITEGEKSSV